MTAPAILYAADGRRIYEPGGAAIAGFLLDRSEMAIIRGPWGCLSGDSEVLTPAGWCRLDAWRGGEIAEWEPTTGDIVWRVPRGFIDEPCGEMWSFTNEHALSMILSDEHRVPVYDWGGRFAVRTADDLARHPSKNRIPVSFWAPVGGGLGWSDERIRLMVAIAADGHVPERGRQIVIAVRKERKKARLRELLAANGLSYSENGRDGRPTETVFAFPRAGLSKGLAAEWWRANRHELQVLIEEVMLWDGSLSKGEYRFSTTRLQEAEIVQYAAHATGRRATISTQEGRREWSTCYCVQITGPESRKGPVYVRGDHTKIERVAAPGGRKYCFATETGFFVARHDKRVFITGNSGKTAACCQRIFQHAVEQNRDSRGQRSSRWFGIRESYPKLETTTMETWLQWFPESVYGKLYTGSKPYRHEVRVGDIKLDVFFMSVEEIATESVFLSLEPTGVWWNELGYARREMFFSAHGRVGRYPSMIEGGSRWSGTIADLNAPPENHWLPMLTGEVELPDDMPLDERIAYKRPEKLAYFVQPPGVVEVRDTAAREPRFEINPKAENLKFLPAGYYERAMVGKTARWIRANLGNQIIPIVEGDAVWPSYNEEVHLSAKELDPVPAAVVGVGLDFGRRPAAVFGQRINGQVQIQYEAAMENAGATRFAPEVRSVLTRFYPNAKTIEFWGDPKGQDGTQTDERTAYDVFASLGMKVRPAPVRQNNIRTRVEAVEYLLDRAPGGRPAILVSPRCRRLKMALAGGYRYPKERPSPVEERKPVKDRYSDIADALQYLVLGWGAGMEMIGWDQDRRAKPVSTRPQGRSRRMGLG